MPIYEYECAKCGVLEIEQRITEDALTTCPDCGSKRFQKLISLSAFHLKGSGWYTTDYARAGNGSGNGEGASSDASEKPSKPADSKEKSKSTTEPKASKSGAKSSGKSSTAAASA